MPKYTFTLSGDFSCSVESDLKGKIEYSSIDDSSFKPDIVEASIEIEADNFAAAKSIYAQFTCHTHVEVEAKKTFQSCREDVSGSVKFKRMNLRFS